MFFIIGLFRIIQDSAMGFNLISNNIIVQLCSNYRIVMEHIDLTSFLSEM